MNLRSELEIINDWKNNFEPLVSICCITYNHENYISDAIESFLLQKTIFPFEIIVGEDCSIDNTREIVEKYKNKYPNLIKVIVSNTNVGMNKNFIRTLNECSGKYIALCEGDDYWTDPKKLQIQVDEMQKYPQIGLSFHLSSAVDNLNNIVTPELYSGNKIYNLEDIITGDFHLVQTNTIVFRKEKLHNLDYKLLSRSPVGDVWIRVCALMPYGALFINRIMGCYRVLSQGSWSISMQDSERFIKYVSDMIKSVNDFDKYWGFKYTKKFFIYKNKLINAVIRKDINYDHKLEFIKNYKKVMTFQNRLLWCFIYSHPKIIAFLRLIRNNIKRIVK